MDDQTNSEDKHREETTHESNIGDLLRSNGGTTASPFEATADIEETRRDRYKQRYKTYIKTPFSIIRKDFRAKIGFAILLFYIIVGLLSIFFVEPTSAMDGAPYMQPFESWEHPFGTDQTGYDLFSQATRSIIPIFKMMMAGALFTILVGTAVGVVAGYKGGTADKVLSTITDVFINLPGLPLVIVLAVLFEPQNPFIIGILLTIASWAGLARSIRSQVLTLREEPYIEAARAMDISIQTILIKEVLPPIMPYITVNTANAARTVIFSAVALYFLGILPYSDANWGVMLNEAYSASAYRRPQAYHWLLIPIIAILVLSIGLILLAQSLDRVFNPRVRARHAEHAEIEDEEEPVSGGISGFQQ